MITHTENHKTHSQLYHIPHSSLFLFELFRYLLLQEYKITIGTEGNDKAIKHTRLLITTTHHKVIEHIITYTQYHKIHSRQYHIFHSSLFLPKHMKDVEINTEPIGCEANDLLTVNDINQIVDIHRILRYYYRYILDVIYG